MKVLRKISDLVKIIGIIILIGTAGASDLGDMGVGDTISYIFLSFSIISFGGVLGELSKLKIRRIRHSEGCKIKKFPKREDAVFQYKKAM